MKKVYVLVLFVFCSLLSATLLAEEEEVAEGEEQVAVPAVYVPLKPQFVVNFGGVGKLRYLKSSVTLRMADSDAANSVTHHLPFIRNNLVMLFTSQTSETLESQEGREQMRLEALEGVRALLKKEDDLPEEAVVDVLFNSLTWH